MAAHYSALNQLVHPLFVQSLPITHEQIAQYELFQTFELGHKKLESALLSARVIWCNKSNTDAASLSAGPMDAQFKSKVNNLHLEFQSKINRLALAGGWMMTDYYSRKSPRTLLVSVEEYLENEGGK